MIQWWFFEREIGRERESCKKQNWDNINVAGAEGDGFEREREREVGMGVYKICSKHKNWIIIVFNEVF